LDDTEIVRQFLAPLGFGALLVAVAVFQLARQSGAFIWFRIGLCMAVGLCLIVFGLNGIAEAGG
jgi:hypothetical protein